MQGILRPRLGIGTVSCPCVLLVASQGPSGFGESGGRLRLLQGLLPNHIAERQTWTREGKGCSYFCIQCTSETQGALTLEEAQSHSVVFCWNLHLSGNQNSYRSPFNLFKWDEQQS